MKKTLLFLFLVVVVGATPALAVSFSYTLGMPEKVLLETNKDIEIPGTITNNGTVNLKYIAGGVSAVPSYGFTFDFGSIGVPFPRFSGHTKRLVL